MLYIVNFSITEGTPASDIFNKGLIAGMEMAFKMVKKTPMINSISLEKERFEAMVPLCIAWE